MRAHLATTWLRGLIAALVVVATVIPLATPAGAQPDFPVPNGRFFQQANGQGGAGNTGYSIANDPLAQFFSEFQSLGGVDAIGYPVSRRFLLDGFVDQAFQKAVFQWRPDLGQVFFVNIMDRLHDAGFDDRLVVSFATPRQLDLSIQETGLSFDQITRDRQAFLDDNPAIRSFYFSVDNPTLRFGLPTSRVEDFGPVLAIRLQRAVLQQWKVDVPWASAGQVVIANGGDLAKQLGFLTTAAILVETAPGTAPQPSGFGFGMQINPGNNPGTGLDLVQQAGFDWIKVQVRWADLEPTPGSFNASAFDFVADQAAARGLNLLMNVTAAPAWARPPNADLTVNGPPANPQTFANFLSRLTAHYKGKVQAIEVWNEQNLSREWGGLGHKLSASQYLGLLSSAYQAIKAVDPSVTVISGGLTPTGVDDGDIAIDDFIYLQQMYDAGLKNNSDAVGEHPSGYNNPPDDDPMHNSTTTTSFKGHHSFYFSSFRQYRDIMVTNGDSDKKLWFTEVGWASSQNPFPEFAYAKDTTDQQQARYLARAFEIGKSAGYVSAMFVFNLNYAATSDQADRFGNRAFAILNPDGTPRPAYVELAAMPK